ncbi:unnamed protein product [Symbiodinium sp. CCMP2592]|nr:unnamed protein product [Symbiodinium sp. CCMP2592]
MGAGAALPTHGDAPEYLQTDSDKELRQNWLWGVQQYASADLQANRKVVLAAVQQNGYALQYASKDLQANKEVVLAAVQQDGRALQYASAYLQAKKEVVLAAVQQNGYALQYASADFQANREFVLFSVQQNGGALEFVSEDLRRDRAFVLQLVEATKAYWLYHFAVEELREDADFRQQCREAAGTGLVWTYYDSYIMFQDMRDRFPATGASVPGGRAYEQVMWKLESSDHGGTATVWFGDTLVWGFATEEGWLHPADECGRDDVPVPAAEGRHPMWSGNVESRSARELPKVNSRHPCWCCHWLREVKRQHDEGKVICCAVSNVYKPAWVDDYGAGSSELSDARAEEFNLAKETFRNGRPEGWGQGTIKINKVKYAREAPVHEWTKKPLGEGCRWERQTLDKTTRVYNILRMLGSIEGLVKQGKEAWDSHERLFKGQLKELVVPTAGRMGPFCVVLVVPLAGTSPEPGACWGTVDLGPAWFVFPQTKVMFVVRRHEMPASNGARRPLQFMIDVVGTPGWPTCRVPMFSAALDLGSCICMRVRAAQVRTDDRSLDHAPEDLQADKELPGAKDLQVDKGFVLQAVQQDGYALEYASKDLRADKDIVIVAVQQTGRALEFASAELRRDRAFVLQLVEATKAYWLYHFASEELSEDADFRQRCREAAGTGLVWTYYESFIMSLDMRRRFPATGASIPGGAAYGQVMDMLKCDNHGGTATVWFGDTPVWGFATEDGWIHPPEECGRDDAPVPAAEGRHPMWSGNVESRSARQPPEINSRHPCWCCHWLREVKRQHDEGKVICCAVSNVFHASWVDEYGAGSSELSDARAEEFDLAKETFRNGRPEGWGQGRIKIHNVELDREAPVHAWTKKPLGEGCRWERQTLDKLNFPVYAFFMP